MSKSELDELAKAFLDAAFDMRQEAFKDGYSGAPEARTAMLLSSDVLNAVGTVYKGAAERAE